MKKNILIKKNCPCKIRDIAGEQFLVPIHDSSIMTENLYRINNTGVYIWSLIEENESITQSSIIQELKNYFPNNEATIKKDVCEFLHILSSENLIEMIFLRNE